nr:MAG TPA: hypothetical protein [Caudoviricetes sp.]
MNELTRLPFYSGTSPTDRNPVCCVRIAAYSRKPGYVSSLIE